MVYLSVMAAAAVLAVALNMAGDHTTIVRYHQHREETSEAQLGQCAVCGGAGVLCTHLPILSIDTGGKKIPGAAIQGPDGYTVAYETSDQGETEIPAELQIRAQEGAWHHLEDEPELTSNILLRIRGNSSRDFSKKSYKIELVSPDNPLAKEKTPLLGMTAESQWALHGPFLDKTLLRNYMWMNLSAEVMGYAPNVRFCELLLDGEYQGVYVLMETIEEGTGRVDLTDYEEGERAFSYMVHLEPQKRLAQTSDSVKTLEDFSFYTMRLEDRVQMELLYPGAAKQTEYVKQYVAADLSDIEHYLYSWEMEKDPDSCWDYLDLESFGDYYILQEYLNITDMFSASTYFYKDVRGKLHIGPVWDYNNCLNNFFVDLSTDEFFLAEKGWYGQLMKSERFVNYVIGRYKSLRKGVLAEDAVERYAREVEAWLGSAVERNYAVWGYSFDSSQLSVRERKNPSLASANQTLEDLNPSSYEEAMEWMLDYAEDRGRWLDQNMDTLRQYCHRSRNAHNLFD